MHQKDKGVKLESISLEDRQVIGEKKVTLNSLARCYAAGVEREAGYSFRKEQQCWAARMHRKVREMGEAKFHRKERELGEARVHRKEGELGAVVKHLKNLKVTRDQQVLYHK